MLGFKVTVKRKNRAAMDKLLRSLMRIGGGPKQVKVGFPAGEVESDVVMRAFWNEFGTRGSGKGFKRKGKGGKEMGGFGGPIPERPFMRNTMRANRGKYQKAMAAEVRGVFWALVKGNSDEVKFNALKKLGVQVQEDIQAEIASLSSPANAPITIALKGSSNPLIDTGEMRQSVTWKVED